jgi:hypothetical protein
MINRYPVTNNPPARTRIILLFVCLILCCRLSAEVSFDAQVPQLQFAASEITAALTARGEQASIKLTVDAAAPLSAEGFSLTRSNTGITVIGKDAAGAMYGGLDVAETIRSQGVAAITATTQNPYMPERGVKFNIPLDVRSPSYSDVGDAAQNNIGEMWNMEFWTKYIDALARSRYNHISLWSMQPFPSLVHVPEYPEVSLADVKRSKGPFMEHYSTLGVGWKGPEFENYETLKVMTIHEKIEFWRAVMAYGKSRNVGFYLVTWNIFDYGINGKYGITDDPNNLTTIDYYRKSVKQLILTYPELKAIGVTTGENMFTQPVGTILAQGAVGEKLPHMKAADKEDWILKTYAAGTLDALAEQPTRKIRFIHRMQMANVHEILSKMEPLLTHPRVDFVYSFKYAQAHVYSATRQPFGEKFSDVIRGKVKTMWTLRNDDVYLFRWAAPDFVREFIKNIPHDISAGCYYGHDGFTIGREFTQLNAESPRQLEIEKHWLQWMLWGRFAYDPDYSNERISALLSARYPEVDSVKLLDAWQKASLVYPRVTGFHWGSLDFKWYIEGTRGRPSYTKSIGAQATSGFHDVETFINLPPHQYAGVQSISDFVAGKTTENLTPFALADLIDRDVDAASATLKAFPAVNNKELTLTLDDIRIICEMGRYYADKIRGSTYVAMARKSALAADKDKAIAALTQASDHYKKYVGLVTLNHVNQIWFNRVGILNFTKQMDDAMADIEIARKIEVKNP